MRRKLFSIISLVLFFAMPFSAWGAGGTSALLERNRDHANSASLLSLGDYGAAVLYRGALT
ncbi:MAG: hypothetical protein Greene041636_545, partial [Parcubacteria group bacterium Greene0416_36]